MPKKTVKKVGNKPKNIEQTSNVEALNIEERKTEYSCSSELTIEGAVALKENLVNLLQADGRVTLDLAAVESVDLAAIQLILAFCKEAWTNKKAFCIKGPFKPTLEKVLIMMDFLVIEGDKEYLFKKLNNEGVCLER